MTGNLSTQTFVDSIRSTWQVAQQRGLDHVDINARDLHTSVGGYPGSNNRMPMCCNAMRSIMTEGDIVLTSPPSGQGASLTIRYALPRR
jgi:hypothetical protein